MENLIQFMIPGNPQAQKRHRTTSFQAGGKNFTREFDPSQSDKADFLSICLNNRPERPITTGIVLGLEFFFPRPQSHFTAGNREKPLKANAPLFVTSKPDVDNLVKFIMDALNKKFWLDDKQIYGLKVIKQYSNIPGTVITIKW